MMSTSPIKQVDSSTKAPLDTHTSKQQRLQNISRLRGHFIVAGNNNNSTSQHIHHDHDNEDEKHPTPTKSARHSHIVSCSPQQWSVHMKDYETSHKMPLLKYMYDLMGLVCVEHAIDGDRDNVDMVVNLLPCRGGLFNSLWRSRSLNATATRKHVPYLKAIATRTRKAVHIPSEIRSILTLARSRYSECCPQLRSPSQLPYKLNGIWECDAKLIRAFNHVLCKWQESKELPSQLCEFHINFWCNGLVAQTNNYPDDTCTKESKADNDDDSDDDEKADEIQKMCTYQHDTSGKKRVVDEETLYADIHNSTAQIDLAELMQQNKALRFQVHKRRKQDEKEKYGVKQDNFEVPDLDGDFESIDDFVQRVCTQSGGVPRNGQAVLWLVDPCNAPEMTIYVWRKPIAYADEICSNVHIGLGQQQMNYRRQKHFEFAYNDTLINAGRFVQFSTCVLRGNIHQFYSVFNAELRFQSSHAVRVWQDFYANVSLFEANAQFTPETNVDKHQRYERYYGKKLMDELQEERTRFTIDALREITKRIKMTKRIMQGLEANKNDEDSDEGKDDDNTTPRPSLDEHSAFVYHMKKAKAKKVLDTDFGVDRNPIKDLSPRQFQQVKENAMAKKWSDVVVDVGREFRDPQQANLDENENNDVHDVD